MKRPRSGIIGAGFMGSVHARAVQAAGGVVSAVAASSRERAAAMAGALGAGRAVASAAALIESDDVDLVHICTPNDLHVSLGQQALAAAKHVICERPLATSVEAAEDLVDAAASAGIVATVPFDAAIGGAARDGLPAFSDGLRAARLTAAVLRSAASGDWQVVG
jgi:predicted dehydrogenase